MIFLKRCNPIPVLLYFIAVPVLAAIYNNPCHTTAALVAGVVMFIASRGRARSFALFFSVFLVTFIVNPILSKKGVTPVLFIGSDPITLEALIYGLNSAILICAVLFLFHTFTYATDSEKLLYLLSPFSATAAMTVSAVIRLVPLYAKQARLISEQQRAIGSNGGDSIPERLKKGARVFSALSTWALENGVTTADSMACRGYGTGRKTFHTSCGMRYPDILFLCSVPVFTAAAVIPSLFSSCTFVYYPQIVKPEVNALYVTSLASYTILVFLPIIFETADRIRWKYLRSRI